MIFSLIKQKSGVWPVKLQCRALGVSASGSYAWLKRKPSNRAIANQNLLQDILRIHLGHARLYGSPRVYQALKAEGQRVSQSIQTRPYGKLVGDCYTVGNVALLASGAIGSKPNAVEGAITFLATGAIYSLRGNNDRWFAVACGTGSAGMLATNFPAVQEALQTLHTTAPATVFGTTVFIAGSAFGALKPALEPTFKAARNFIVRNTFGRPRAVMGTASAASKVFMLSDALVSHNAVFTGILGVWLAGDYCMTKSSQPRRAATPKLPSGSRFETNDQA